VASGAWDLGAFPHVPHLPHLWCGVVPRVR